jgi:hypothetical protein
MLLGPEGGRAAGALCLDGRPYRVEEILDQWYGPQDSFYKVRAEDNNLYILRHETSTPEGTWHLVSFRQQS